MTLKKWVAASAVMMAAVMCVPAAGQAERGMTVYAASTTNTGNEKAGKEKACNHVQVGKITSIGSNTITVELGEITKPEKDTSAAGTDQAVKTEGSRKAGKTEKAENAGKAGKGTAGSKQDVKESEKNAAKDNRNKAKSDKGTENGSKSEKNSAREEKKPEDMVTLTGTSLKIKIDDDTKFFSGEGELKLSDLAKGDYIFFALDDDGDKEAEWISKDRPFRGSMRGGSPKNNSSRENGAKSTDQKNNSPRGNGAKSTDQKDNSSRENGAKSTDQKNNSPRGNGAKSTEQKNNSPRGNGAKSTDQKDNGSRENGAKNGGQKKNGKEGKPGMKNGKSGNGSGNGNPGKKDGRH